MGSLLSFRAERVQRGYGIGSFFKSIARFAIPLVKQRVQVVGKWAPKTAIDVGKDTGVATNFFRGVKL